MPISVRNNLVSVRSLAPPAAEVGHRPHLGQIFLHQCARLGQALIVGVGSLRACSGLCRSWSMSTTRNRATSSSGRSPGSEHVMMSSRSRGDTAMTVGLASSTG